MTHVADLLIALNAAPGLSRPAICRLARELDRWAVPPGSPDPLRPRTPEQMTAGIGVPRAALDRALALAARPAEVAESAAREREEAARLGARIVTAGEAGYPAGLEHLALPPPVLYLQGELPLGLAVAIVGSRKADAYGLEVAESFARALAEAGVAVVSGFARGIDAAAHRGALAVTGGAGGTTVAVLGCGLGVDYPAGQARLAREIAGRGARLSELPCGAPPRAWHFPVRNRLIAALTVGTLVVQAAPRSGSLVTVRHALDLGREIWAVPGRIFDERSVGPNALIRDGAALVQHPREILEALEILPGNLPLFPETASAEPEPPPGFPGQVFAALPRGGGRAAEEVAVELGAPMDQVLGALLELELAGQVKRLPGSAYGR